MRNRHPFEKRKHSGLLLLLALAAAPMGLAQSRPRNEIRVPDIPGFALLKCDFHMHTVFSDGNVWPTVRVDEAWAGGLDALSITDHLEYAPHGDDVRRNADRPHEIARGPAAEYGLLLVRGAEITRDMPPGHFNALFLSDAEALRNKDWRKSMTVAAGQGAFLFWNHPGWRGQQPDGVSRWYPVHDSLLAAGRMHGIEIVNEKEYYPEAHRWGIEKNLTLMANSDLHDPAQSMYDPAAGDPRPMTWVAARTRDLAGVREALFARRTVCFFKGNLIGSADLLQPIFSGAVRPASDTLLIRGGTRGALILRNGSGLSFRLRLKADPGIASLPETVDLPADRSVLVGFNLRKKLKTGSEPLRLSCTVENLWTGPGRGLETGLDFVCLPAKAE